MPGNKLRHDTAKAKVCPINSSVKSSDEVATMIMMPDPIGITQPIDAAARWYRLVIPHQQALAFLRTLLSSFQKQSQERKFWQCFRDPARARQRRHDCHLDAGIHEWTGMNPTRQRWLRFPRIRNDTQREARPKMNRILNNKAPSETFHLPHWQGGSGEKTCKASPTN